MVLLLLQGLLPAISAFLLKQIVDGLTLRLAWAQVVSYASAFGAVLLCGEVLRGVTTLVRAQQGELLQDHLRALIQRQSVAVDYAFYELPEYYDHLHRARGEAGYRPQQLLETVGGLLQDGVTLLALLVVLVPFGWWLPLVLVLATLPSLFVVLRHTLYRYEWRRATTAAERRAWYYDWVLTASETAAELRLFALGEHFQRAYAEVRATLRRETLRLARREALAGLLASVLALVFTGAALGWMGWRAWQGTISLGVLALFYQAFNQGQQALRALLGHVGALYENGLFLGDLFAFLDLQPQRSALPSSDNALTSHYAESQLAVLPAGRRVEQAGQQASGADAPSSADVSSSMDDESLRVAATSFGHLPDGLNQAICFEKVSFAYPSARGLADVEQLVEQPAEGNPSVVGGRVALRDFDLTIHAGELVAIVGLNGAGKTTLLKLLCRLYDPTAGRITWDGVDLRCFDPAALRRNITVLFQRPVDYQMSVADNIALGALESQQPTRAAIEEAAHAAAVDEIAQRLPQGLDTLLGKWFAEGTELSVGEWQRVALARAFLRQAPLVLLDEPTSAMDAWNEMTWLRRLRALLHNRTALLITHRFTTAMHADRIYVMDAGRVIESGTHEELLAQGGRYAESWREQTQQTR